MPPTMFIATKGGGQAFAFPDVCLTPAPPAPNPIPMPYPNIGQLPQAVKTATKVKVVEKEVLLQNSEIPMSQGDELGVSGGVQSGVNMNKVTFKKGSAKVKIEGHPVIYHLSMTGHNGLAPNIPSGTIVLCSQTKVLVSP